MSLPYIYMITDTRNGMKDIGKHCGNNESYFTGSTILNSIRKKYGTRENKIPSFLEKKIIVQGDFNELLLNELERHYIRLFNTKFPNGYNLTDGGDGNTDVPDIVRKKISETLKKRNYTAWNKGKHYKPNRTSYAHTEESRNKLKEAWKRDYENRVLILKESTRDRKRKPSKYNFAQFEKDGTTLIKIWDCRKDIENELGLRVNKISYICRGNISSKVTEGGFRWKYVDKKTGEIIEPAIKIHGNKGKKYTREHSNKILETKRLRNSSSKPVYPVYQFSLDGQLIKKWNTREVREAFNLTDSQFQRIVYGLSKVNPHEYGGFLWKRNLIP